MPLPPRPTWWAGAPRTVVIPLLVGIVTVVGTSFAAWHQPAARPLDALGIALLLAGPVALVARRWHPPAALAVAVSALVVYLALGFPFGPVFLPALVGLCSAVAAGHRLGAYAVAAAGYLAVTVLDLVRDPGGWDWGWALTVLVWLAAVIAGAEGWRARRERLAQARAARAETERRRGSEERLRIAQELHDVLGHHVSLINVQAGVALYLMDDDPEQARTALTAIKQSSRDLLHEMRSTLGILRAVDELPPHHPMPGIAQLEPLVSDVRAAGLPVELDVRGVPRGLPPTVDLAAYRIVQEALTNTRRHAGPARARVLLTYEESGLTVQVDDDGRGAGAAPAGSAETSAAGGADEGADGGADGGGNGLPGMRERAHALGGTLTGGPRPEGGFRVRAHLPVAPGPGPGARA